jgi:hypothetical protein
VVERLLSKCEVLSSIPGRSGPGPGECSVNFSHILRMHFYSVSLELELLETTATQGRAI